MKKLSVWLIPILALVIAITQWGSALRPVSIAAAQAYYVATNGGDSNPGTESEPTPSPYPTNTPWPDQPE